MHAIFKFLGMGKRNLDSLLSPEKFPPYVVKPPLAAENSPNPPWPRAGHARVFLPLVGKGSSPSVNSDFKSFCRCDGEDKGKKKGSAHFIP